MNNFRKLKVWEKAVSLATDVYNLTRRFPKDELYGLVSQMHRSAVSIGSNIAEGAGRGSQKEFRQFLNIATGSSYELETQLTISRNLKYISNDEFNSIRVSIVEIQKMLYSLKNTIA